MAPEVDSLAYAEPEFVSVPAPPRGSFIGSPVETAEIDGALGGTLANGRFHLTIPPGSFSGTATISISVPDPTAMHCELDISSASATQFDAPVQLVADCSGASVADLADLETLELDEATQRWVLVVGSAVQLTTGIVTTPIQEFSEYGIVDGKAGW